MKAGFRQSMSWLHTWGGLSCGWLLCAILLSGSLSVFREPITRWMEAAPPISDIDPSASPSAGVPAALDYLAAHAAGATYWRLELPARPGDALLVAWRQGAGEREVALHPLSAQPLPLPWKRATEGGRHFMSFHYMLQWRSLGYWIVGWVSMGLLVALVSGLVVHRRIFQDFFTFRPGKGARSWLDAHNASGVIALPFHLMIVYTGLAIFFTSYLPWPLHALYGFDDNAYERFHDELVHTAPPRNSPVSGATTVPERLRQATALLGQAPRLLVLNAPGSADMTLQVFTRAAPGTPARALAHSGGSVTFAGADAAILDFSPSDPTQLSQGERIQRTLESLHFADFGGWGLRWLYFLLGLLGAVMAGSGTLLFASKRRQRSAQEFAGATATVYRLIEALNTAAIVGIGLASIGFLYANRLLPIELAARAGWEIRAFLLIWLGSLLHALLRPLYRAWIEQLQVAGLLCAGVPLLNALSTGQGLWPYLQNGDWQRAGVEATCLAFAGVFAFAARRVQRHQSAPRVVSRPATLKTLGIRQRAWRIIARVLLATLGSYLQVALLLCVLALTLVRLIGLSPALAVLLTTLLGFAVLAAFVVRIFAIERGTTALREQLFCALGLGMLLLLCVAKH